MATYKYLSPEGVIVPDTSAILDETNQEWKSVLGQDLDVNPETPQGVLIASDVAVRSEVVANNAAVANQINPNYAGGVFLDDIWAFMGGKRRAATYTLVDGVNLTGIPGVVIPSGSRRATPAGDVFQLLTTVQLDNATGKGVGIFQALEPGPIPCAAHALTVPVQGYTSVGWETSDNPNAGSVGRAVQSDLSAKQERVQTLGLQGRSVSDAVYANVRALEGVRSISYRENYTKADATIDGIFLVANSVWVCVDGGVDGDIAQALYRSKTSGANWNGAVTVNYVEPRFGQNFPIKFDRPTPKPIMTRVSYTVVGSISGDPTALIKQAVVDYAKGLLENGEEGFVLGEDVSPFEIAAAVNYRVPSLFISKVEIADKATTPTWSVVTKAIGLNEKATIDLDSVLAVAV